MPSSETRCPACNRIVQTIKAFGALRYAMHNRDANAKRILTATRCEYSYQLVKKGN